MYKNRLNEIMEEFNNYQKQKDELFNIEGKYWARRLLWAVIAAGCFGYAVGYIVAYTPHNQDKIETVGEGE